MVILIISWYWQARRSMNHRIHPFCHVLYCFRRRSQSHHKIPCLELHHIGTSAIATWLQWMTGICHADNDRSMTDVYRWTELSLSLSLLHTLSVWTRDTVQTISGVRLCTVGVPYIVKHGDESEKSGKQETDTNLYALTWSDVRTRTKRSECCISYAFDTFRSALDIYCNELLCGLWSPRLSIAGGHKFF